MDCGMNLRMARFLMEQKISAVTRTHDFLVLEALTRSVIGNTS